MMITQNNVHCAIRMQSFSDKLNCERPRSTPQPFVGLSLYSKVKDLQCYNFLNPTLFHVDVRWPTYSIRMTPDLKFTSYKTEKDVRWSSYSIKTTPDLK